MAEPITNNAPALPGIPGAGDAGQIPVVPDAGATPTPDAGQAPGFDPQAAMADLQSGFAGLKNKEAETNSKKMMNENDVEAVRAQVVQDLFEVMKKNGVDPSDVNSISNFLDGLKEIDPDLYELFDFVFSNLTGQPQTTTPPEMSGDFTPAPGPGDQPSADAGAMSAPPPMGGSPMPGLPPTGMPPLPTEPPTSGKTPGDFKNLTAALG